MGGDGGNISGGRDGDAGWDGGRLSSGEAMLLESGREAVCAIQVRELGVWCWVSTGPVDWLVSWLAVILYFVVSEVLRFFLKVHLEQGVLARSKSKRDVSIRSVYANLRCWQL